MGARACTAWCAAAGYCPVRRDLADRGGGEAVAVWSRSTAVISGLLYVLAFVRRDGCGRTGRGKPRTRCCVNCSRYRPTSRQAVPGKVTAKAPARMFGADAVVVLLPGGLAPCGRDSCGCRFLSLSTAAGPHDEVFAATSTIDALAAAAGVPRVGGRARAGRQDSFRDRGTGADRGGSWRGGAAQPLPPLVRRR